MNELAVILLGFFGGAVGGLVGVGGGVLFVPALAIFMGQSQLEAEASSLVAIVLVALAGTWRQLGYGNVRLRDAAVIGVLSPLGVVAGTVLANNVSERALEVAFACLVLFFAAQLLRRSFSEPAPGETR
ncbi:MAG TPA: sulfite exporter TauE/SafE family protein [Solirubrobacterales bacterium]|nr:sulfite exporter TauE/SafE family protein [Solirubrobacterales bacterium]